jgi:predicted HTH domain antitoxin
MSHVVTMQIDEGLVALLRQSNLPLPEVIQELVALELYRRHAISSGRAAELLGMERFEFVRHASRLGIPFFDEGAEELAEDDALGREL